MPISPALVERVARALCALSISREWRLPVDDYRVATAVNQHWRLQIDNAAAALSASGVERLVETLRFIAEMTDIEADFDGFTARGAARKALASYEGKSHG